MELNDDEDEDGVLTFAFQVYNGNDLLGDSNGLHTPTRDGSTPVTTTPGGSAEPYRRAPAFFSLYNLTETEARFVRPGVGATLKLGRGWTFSPDVHPSLCFYLASEKKLMLNETECLGRCKDPSRWATVVDAAAHDVSSTSSASTTPVRKETRSFKEMKAAFAASFGPPPAAKKAKTSM